MASLYPHLVLRRLPPRPRPPLWPTVRRTVLLGALWAGGLYVVVRVLAGVLDYCGGFR